MDRFFNSSSDRWTCAAMNECSSSPFRFALWDLMVLPAIVGLVLFRGGMESLREGVPLVFAFWVAIRQHNVKGLPLINPFTVGMLSGMIWFCVYEVVLAFSGQSIALTTIGRAALFGGLAGIGYGLLACVYVAMALSVWQSAGKRLFGRRREHSRNAASPSPLADGD